MIKVCAYYTAGAYEREVQPLLSSLERFKLFYEVHQEPSLKTWLDAVLWKPSFILETLSNSSADGVLYTDADSEFKAKPDFSIFKDADVSWHRFRRGPLHIEENLTGTMFLRRTPEVLYFVEKWVEATARPEYRKKFTPEQDSLTWVWHQEINEKLRFLPLPPTYCWFDACVEVYGDKYPVIAHRQASRKYRHAEEEKTKDATTAPTSSGGRLGDADRSAPEAGTESEGDRRPLEEISGGGLLSDGRPESPGVNVT